jgi:hypothetical protein
MPVAAGWPSPCAPVRSTSASEWSLRPGRPRDDGARTGDSVRRGERGISLRNRQTAGRNRRNATRGRPYRSTSHCVSRMAACRAVHMFAHGERWFRLSSFAFQLPSKCLASGQECQGCHQEYQGESLILLILLEESQRERVSKPCPRVSRVSNSLPGTLRDTLRSFGAPRSAILIAATLATRWRLLLPRGCVVAIHLPR